MNILNFLPFLHITTTHIDILTPKQIAFDCEDKKTGRANRRAINHLFRVQDDTPVGQPNITERAIRRAKWCNSMAAIKPRGYDYASFLFGIITCIKNEK